MDVYPLSSLKSFLIAGMNVLSQLTKSRYRCYKKWDMLMSTNIKLGQSIIVDRLRLIDNNGL